MVGVVAHARSAPCAMSASNCIMLDHEGPLQLADKVIVGIVDVAAVGARVLLSLEPPPNWTVRETALQLRGIQLKSTSTSTSSPKHAPDDLAGRQEDEALRPILMAARGVLQSPLSSVSTSTPPVAVLRNFYPPSVAAGSMVDAPGQCSASTSPQVSLLVLNTVVPDDDQGEVAMALLDILNGGRESVALAASSATEENRAAGSTGAIAAASEAAAAGGCVSPTRLITVVAAMLLQQLAQPAALYQLLLNGAEPLDPALQPLQPSTPSVSAGGSPVSAAVVRIRDGQLAALLHVLGMSGTPTACLLAPGHKPPASTSLNLPGSVAACDALGTALAAAYKLQYDPGHCQAIQALYKWFVPEKSTGSDVMYL